MKYLLYMWNIEQSLMIVPQLKIKTDGFLKMSLSWNQYENETTTYEFFNEKWMELRNLFLFTVPSFHKSFW